ncbi:thiamine-phosphate kinase [Acuticoccus sp. M5D2P5]|uniref:thiamine-phosphate kinase n=1 Tax=Acuticoccus kalidii TaxID=2910977 RepID=UPI001F1A711C|nr:thiamine-phosphate kinase [Acuticoccus kalidii]MCF3936355.1 thiamine-phosphate kinase [Acuticoccus kalidii]
MAMDEDALIANLFAPLATDAGADALGDDAATFAAGEGDIVVTCDALAAGVHFFPDDPPGAIAAKALRVNLSDLAAKGAAPFGYLLVLALGTGWTPDWARAFADGLAADQRRYGLTLLGGDTLRAAGGTTVAVTAFGRVPSGKVVRRRNAAIGDVVTVTGTIGDSALGLACRLGRGPHGLGAADRAALEAAYLWPDPPVAGWRAVLGHAHASMDVSDGLVGDLAKLCGVAGVGARLAVERVPLSAAAKAAVAADPKALDTALTGGDDYQILATLPPAAIAPYRAALAAEGIAVAEIGTIVEGEGVVLERDGAPIKLADGRFQHF